MDRKFRKNYREKQRRSELNDKFEALCEILNLQGKNEKFTILAEAINLITSLQNRVNELKQERNSLKEEIHQLTSCLQRAFPGQYPHFQNANVNPTQTQPFAPAPPSSVQATPTPHPTSSATTATNTTTATAPHSLPQFSLGTLPHFSGSQHNTHGHNSSLPTTTQHNDSVIHPHLDLSRTNFTQLPNEPHIRNPNLTTNTTNRIHGLGFIAGLLPDQQLRFSSVSLSLPSGKKDPPPEPELSYNDMHMDSSSDEQEGFKLY